MSTPQNRAHGYTVRRPIPHRPPTQPSAADNLTLYNTHPILRRDPTRGLRPERTYSVSCYCIWDPEQDPNTKALIFGLVLDPAGLQIDNAVLHMYHIKPLARRIHAKGPEPHQSLAGLPPLTGLGVVSWDHREQLMKVVDRAVYETVWMRAELRKKDMELKEYDERLRGIGEQPDFMEEDVEKRRREFEEPESFIPQVIEDMRTLGVEVVPRQ
ncbi:hypothetical protein BJY01DRAFT_250853 [Aspergillus pseudoustus]|uniref:CST complex subunit Stn1 N-terminal domain-containing protein n=1 Tax=Aspergillus pseudoustus TaxID=1810923 RepID=A0ABR4JF05_9EURO